MRLFRAVSYSGVYFGLANHGLAKSYRLFLSVLLWHSLSRGHHFYLPYPPLLRTPDAKNNQKRIKT